MDLVATLTFKGMQHIQADVKSVVENERNNRQRAISEDEEKKVYDMLRTDTLEEIV